MQNIKEPIDLKTLVGPHILTGCDINTEQVLDWGESHISAGVIRFILDGKVYEAIENPDDGYRSSLEGLHLADPNKNVVNTFPAVEVTGRYLGDVDDSDIIEFLNAANGKDVIRVGTAHVTDYYPGCVMEFNQQNV